MMIVVTHLYYQSVNEQEGAEAKEHQFEDSEASGSQVSAFSSCASSATDDVQADELNALR